MRRFATLFTALLCLLPVHAFALGLGTSLELGAGGGRFHYEDADLGYDGKYDLDSASSLGIAFVLDTGRSLTTPVAYRLGAGFEGLTLALEDGPAYKLGGFALDNTLRVRLAAREGWRVWMGPQMRLAGYSGESDDEIAGEHEDIALGAFGMGLLAGADFRLGNSPHFLSAGLGFRRTWYAGEVEWKDISSHVRARTNMAFVNVAVLFGGARDAARAPAPPKKTQPKREKAPPPKPPKGSET